MHTLKLQLVNQNILLQTQIKHLQGIQ